MKAFIFALLLTPTIAYAHCPISLEINGERFCTHIDWQTGDIKTQGQFQASDAMSPYLVPSGEIPQKWIYSNAELMIWKDGDSAHVPQMPTGLRIFPYMVMENGMHHSAGHTFTANNDSQTFTVQHLALQSMKGCWSLRWTTHESNDLATSHHLVNIVDYTNINASENEQMALFCETLSAGDTPNDGGHHQHH